jgi:hypothetical protein
MGPPTGWVYRGPDRFAMAKFEAHETPLYIIDLKLELSKINSSL